MKLKNRLPLNIQFFAEGDPATENSAKTFSQEEVNGLVATETQKALETFLKELGFNGKGDAQEQTKLFKEWQESQKTDLQKVTEKAGTLESENLVLAQEKAQLELKITCLKGGCSPEAIEDVSLLAGKLVTDEVGMEEAVKQVLEKYPAFKSEQETVITGSTPSEGKSTPGQAKQSSVNDFVAAIRESQVKRK